MILPKSAKGKALAYIINRWEKLPNYLMNDKLEIPNNPFENLMRPGAIGRKNYFFAGSYGAAQCATMIYSFLAIPIHGTSSAKRKM